MLFFDKNTEKVVRDFFSEGELLFDKVTMDSLIKFVESDRVKIIKIKESYNSWGDFTFMDFLIDGRYHLQVYSFGLHSYSGKYLYDEFPLVFCDKLSDTSGKKLHSVMQKSEFINFLNENHKKYKELQLNNDEQTEDEYLFEMLAEMGDEDGAWSMIYG